MKSNKLGTYIVMGKVQIDTTCKVTASSLEEAINKARDLKEEDFVDILGDYNDGSLKVYGVFEE
jgi:hypothetical protein